jgi:hypothetical protein
LRFSPARPMHAPNRKWVTGSNQFESSLSQDSNTPE